MYVEVSVPPYEGFQDKHYVEQLEILRRTDPSVPFVPTDQGAYARGQDVYNLSASRHAQRVAQAAAIADCAIPAGTGQTL